MIYVHDFTGDDMRTQGYILDNTTIIPPRRVDPTPASVVPLRAVPVAEQHANVAQAVAAELRAIADTIEAKLEEGYALDRTDMREVIGRHRLLAQRLEPPAAETGTERLRP